jgi:hypothetical protein
MSCEYHCWSEPSKDAVRSPKAIKDDLLSVIVDPTEHIIQDQDILSRIYSAGQSLQASQVRIMYQRIFDNEALPHAVFVHHSSLPLLCQRNKSLRLEVFRYPHL